MKEYTIKIGEVFTEEKAKELKEYLGAKDLDVEMNKPYKQRRLSHDSK